MSETERQPGRLRQHPDERFAAAQLEVDLGTTTTKLRSEPHAGERGHRQETLYRRDGYTIALFAFDRFTGLSKHTANGIVNMHVLRGCMEITANDQVHELRAGQMLIPRAWNGARRSGRRGRRDACDRSSGGERRR